MLGFAIWFLSQSLYVIGSLCIFCLICFAGLLAANWGWMRLNADDLPLGKRGRRLVKQAMASGSDTFVWIMFAIVLTFLVILRFA
jgi:hypothetical protein